VIRFVVVSLIALAAAALVADGEMKIAGCAWALAFANGLVGLWIDRRTVRMRGEQSVLISMMMHFARVMFLILAMVALKSPMSGDYSRFIGATLAAYFVFLFGEVARLARSKQQ
jgi:hypothetical protein